MAHVELPLSLNLWEFDHKYGLLTFNIRHPLWVKLDSTASGKRSKKHDRQIVQLQNWILMQVITLLKYSEDEFEIRREVADAQAPLYVDSFILGDDT